MLQLKRAKKDKASKRPHRYSLDNSAIVHIASRRRKYTNMFRLTVTLTEPVCSETLQMALNRIYQRFPTIVAGVRCNAFQYVIVPAETPPEVQPDTERLAFMPPEMTKSCAVRILYTEKQIAVELFHVLTDGYGGVVFLNTLLAEYISLKYNISCGYSEQIVNPCDLPCEAELADDFPIHAAQTPAPATRRKIYHLPAAYSPDMPVQTLTGTYRTQELLNAAHNYGTTLTTFLTTVMYTAILRVRQHHWKADTAKMPLQIMIPVNLRNRFRSRTLRNFTLYALPCVEANAAELSFEQLIQKVSAQMHDQLSEQHLRAMIAKNVRSQNLACYRLMPVPIKNLILRLVYHLYGERNSCLSLSNLGRVEYPAELQPYIRDLEFQLSPRRTSPYNCGIVSCNGNSFISFTRKANHPKLEEHFFSVLESILEKNRKNAY